MNIKTKFSIEIEIEIEGLYQAGQPAIMPNSSNEVGEPAEPEFIEINAVNRIGIVTFAPNVRNHSTEWFAISKAVREELLKIIINNVNLNDIAEDAIRDAAIDYE